MNPEFTKDEINVLYEVYNAIASNPEVKMTQEAASVMSGILKRVTPKERLKNGEVVRIYPKKIDDFKALHLLSIKTVVEQTLNSLTPEQRKEFPLFETILKKVSKLVK